MKKLREFRKSRNLRNSLWNVFEVLSTPLIFFISIPIFLEQLGELEYGMWMLVNSIVLLMQGMNLGLHFSTYKHVSVALPENDQEQITRTLTANLSLNVLIFLASLIVCSVLSFCIYRFSWFGDSISSPHSLVITLYLAMGVLFTRLTDLILYNVYRAFEDFKYVTILKVVGKLILVFGNLYIAYTTHSVIDIFCFTLFISAVSTALNYRLMRKFLPFYRFKLSFKKEWIRFEVNYSLIIWLQSIAVIIIYQGDRILVSYAYGLQVLSFYTIVATLFNHIHIAFSALLSWMFPQVAKRKVNQEAIWEMYISARNISITFSVFLMALFTLCSEQLFSLWLGKENFYKMQDFLRWFSVFEFFFIFTIMPDFFLNASDNEKFSLKLVAVYTGLNLIGMVVGAYLGGSAIGLSAGLAISTFFGMFYLHRSIELKFGNTRKSHEGLFLLFIPSFLGSGIVFCDGFLGKALFFISCVAAGYFIFVHRLKTNFKLMVQ